MSTYFFPEADGPPCILAVRRIAASPLQVCSPIRVFFVSVHYFFLHASLSLLLVPDGLPPPLQLEAGVAPHLDRGRLGGVDRLLDGLVQPVRVVLEHLHGLLVLLRLHRVVHHRRLHRGDHAQLRAQSRNFLADLMRTREREKGEKSRKTMKALLVSVALRADLFIYLGLSLPAADLS